MAVRSRSALSCIVEDDRTGGGAGVQAWAQKMGFTTFPLRSPIYDIPPELSPLGNCLITAGNSGWDPLGRELQDEHWQVVSNWIRAGNTLIVITANPESLPPLIEDLFTKKEEILAPGFGDTGRPAAFEQSRRSPFSMAKVEYQSIPTRWHAFFSVHADGPRLKHLRPDWQIAGEGESTVLAGRPLGLGMLYLLLDESAWSNERFDQGDNAATLGRILKQNMGPDGVLAFDEYRHGYGRVESFVSLFLRLPGASSMALMGITWGAFCLWAGSRRIGPPDEYHEVERRTVSEYIESVAAMNQRARAAPLAIQSVLQRVRSLLQKKGVKNDVIEGTFQRAAQRAELATRPPVPTQEIKLVCELIRLRKEFYGTRQSS